MSANKACRASYVPYLPLSSVRYSAHRWVLQKDKPARPATYVRNKSLQSQPRASYTLLACVRCSARRWVLQKDKPAEPAIPPASLGQQQQQQHEQPYANGGSGEDLEASRSSRSQSDWSAVVCSLRAHALSSSTRALILSICPLGEVSQSVLRLRSPSPTAFIELEGIHEQHEH
eukprot:scaffold261976_cov26-Tisochrysis_lutea.AAC.2